MWVWAEFETEGIERERSDKQIQAWERRDGVGADTELSCGMREKTESDTLHWSSSFSWVQLFASTHKLILTLLSWLNGSVCFNKQLFYHQTKCCLSPKEKSIRFCFNHLWTWRQTGLPCVSWNRKRQRCVFTVYELRRKVRLTVFSLSQKIYVLLKQKRLCWCRVALNVLPDSNRPFSQNDCK